MMMALIAMKGGGQNSLDSVLRDLDPKEEEKERGNPTTESATTVVAKAT